MAGLPLERFDPVPLDELVAEAELLTRFDRKYLVPVDVAAALLDRIDARSRVLEIGSPRSAAAGASSSARAATSTRATRSWS